MCMCWYTGWCAQTCACWHPSAASKIPSLDNNHEGCDAGILPLKMSVETIVQLQEGHLWMMRMRTMRTTRMRRMKKRRSCLGPPTLSRQKDRKPPAKLHVDQQDTSGDSGVHLPRELCPCDWLNIHSISLHPPGEYLCSCQSGLYASYTSNTLAGVRALHHVSVFSGSHWV